MTSFRQSENVIVL